MSEFFATEQDSAQARLDAELAPEARRGFWDRPFQDIWSDIGAGISSGGEGANQFMITGGRWLSDGGLFGNPLAAAAAIDPTPRDNWWENHFTESRDWLADQRRRLTVDPATRSESANIIGGVSRALSTFFSGSLVGGPAGAVTGPVWAGFGFGRETQERLRNEGLSEGEALAGGVIEGGFMTAMGFAPIALPGRIITRATTGAGVNLAFGAGMRGSMNAYLNAQGYPELAERYQWLDPRAATIDAILGAAFGATFGRRAPASVRAHPAPDGEAPESAPLLPQDADGFFEEARQYGTDEQYAEAYAYALIARDLGHAEADGLISLIEEDASAADLDAGRAIAEEITARVPDELVGAAIVEADSIQRETAFGVPVNHASVRFQAEALERMEQQVARDEALNPGLAPEGVDFVPLPDDPDAAMKALRAEAEARGIPPEMLASQGVEEGGHSPAEVLQQRADREFADELGPGWFNALQRAGKAHIVASRNDIPTDDFTGIPRGVQAVHIRSRRETYFVAGNIRPEAMRGLILHEIGVHHGMEQMLGKRGMREVLRQIERMVEDGHPDVVNARDLVESYNYRPESVPEETLAYLIEEHADSPLVVRMLSRLRQWMIKTFGSTFGMRLTVDDLRALALASLRRVAEQARREAGEVVEVPAPRPASDANNRQDGWLDEQLFHGTTRDFEQFDIARAGEGIGSPRERAIWLTPDPYAAPRFAGGSVEFGAAYPEGANVRPVQIRGRIKDIDMRRQEVNGLRLNRYIEQARREGYDGVRFRDLIERNHNIAGDQVAIFNPQNTRPWVQSGQRSPVRDNSGRIVDSSPRPEAPQGGMGPIGYRGTREPYDPSRIRQDSIEFFSDREATARGYGPNITSRRMNLGRSLVVDAKGEGWLDIDPAQLRSADERLPAMMPDPEFFAANDIAKAARDLGYDSVTFRNIRDNNRAGGKPSTVFATWQRGLSDGDSGLASFGARSVLEQGPLPLESRAYQERLGDVQRDLQDKGLIADGTASGRETAARGGARKGKGGDDGALDPGAVQRERAERERDRASGQGRAELDRATVRGILDVSGLRIQSMKDLANGEFMVTVDAPFKLETDAGRALLGATDVKGEAPAHIRFDIRGPASARYVQIKWTGVGHNVQGKGAGSWLYRTLADWAFDEGYAAVYSDASVSSEAQAVYQSLERRGYAVQRSQRAIRGEEGELRTTDFSPVFKVTRGESVPARDHAAPPPAGWMIDGLTIAERLEQIRARQEAYDKLSPAEQAIADDPDMMFSYGPAAKEKISAARLRDDARIEAETARAMRKGYEAAARCAARHGAQSFITLGVTPAASASAGLGHVLGLATSIPLGVTVAPVIARSADPEGYSRRREQTHLGNARYAMDQARAIADEALGSHDERFPITEEGALPGPIEDLDPAELGGSGQNEGYRKPGQAVPPDDPRMAKDRTGATNAEDLIDLFDPILGAELAEGDE